MNTEQVKISSKCRQLTGIGGGGEVHTLQNHKTSQKQGYKKNQVMGSSVKRITALVLKLG